MHQKSCNYLFEELCVDSVGIGYRIGMLCKLLHAWRSCYDRHYDITIHVTNPFVSSFIMDRRWQCGPPQADEAKDMKMIVAITSLAARCSTKRGVYYVYHCA